VQTVASKSADIVRRIFQFVIRMAATSFQTPIYQTILTKAMEYWTFVQTPFGVGP
jgi:hypothetical protein